MVVAFCVFFFFFFLVFFFFFFFFLCGYGSNVGEDGVAACDADIIVLWQWIVGGGVVFKDDLIACGLASHW